MSDVTARPRGQIVWIVGDSVPFVQEKRWQRFRYGLEQFGKRIRGPLRVFWVLAMVTIVARYCYTSWSEILALGRSMGIVELVGMVAVTITAKPLLSEQCLMTTEALGRSFPRRQMFWIYSSSDLAKYIPGGVWNALARVGLYSVNGMSTTGAARSFALEKYWQIVGAGIVGVILLTPSVHARIMPATMPSTVFFHVLEVVVLCALWCVATQVGSILIAGTRRAWSTVWLVMAEQLGIAVTLGLGLSIPLAALGAEVSIATSVGAFALGRAVGYVAVFAPAGIGVREVVGLWALGGSVGDEIALFALAVNRVTTTIVDFGTFGLAYVVRPRPEDKTTEGDPSNFVVGQLEI